jgi:hypothetical protein
MMQVVDENRIIADFRLEMVATKNNLFKNQGSERDELYHGWVVKSGAAALVAGRIERSAR